MNEVKRPLLFLMGNLLLWSLSTATAQTLDVQVRLDVSSSGQMSAERDWDEERR
jgi:hypothetical protein